MNYKESTQILEEVQKAKKILVNCHRGPDPDSIGCALAMYQVLTKMGKDVQIVCPSRNLYDKVNFLKNYEKIQKEVAFSKLNFSEFDLFVVLDSSNWDQVVGRKDFIPDVKTVVVDHHVNDFFGFINLVDSKIGSVGELLFCVFEDWGVALDKEIAACILTAMTADTGCYSFPGSTQRTFEITKKLMDLGADRDFLLDQLLGSEPYDLVKFYGEVLFRMKKGNGGDFVWSAIPYAIYEKYGKPASARSSSSSFLENIGETKLGFVAVEEEKNLVAVSFRSRNKLDVSKIAKYFGGGGHENAASAKIDGLAYNEAVKKVLQGVRKFLKDNAKY